MQRRSHFLWGLPIAVGLMLDVAPAAAFAGPPDKARAASEFAEGQRAFKAGDFRRAAESFEAAYRDAPHYSPLWNAARSWEKSGEPARAANLYARYLREAPPNARDRDNATQALKALAPKLGHLEVHAPGFDALTVDEAEIEDASIYVNPGEHAVAAQYGGRPVHKSVTVRAGEVIATTLEPPAEPTPAPASDAQPEHADATARIEPPRAEGWSPAVVAVGAGLTAVGIGLTLWSGIDTSHQKTAFDSSHTQSDLDAGRNKETRTNVFLGATIGVAALTGIAAAVLVDWKGGKGERSAPRVGVGLGSVRVEGTF